MKVTVCGEVREYEKGCEYEQIAREFQPKFDEQIILATVDGKLNELNKKVTKDCTVEFLTAKDRTGYKTYRRSCTFMLIKAFRDVVGADNLKRFKVEFALSKGLFCNVDGDFTLDEALLDKVLARMDEMVKMDIPITKKSYPLAEAVEIFRQQGMEDKVNLFKFRRASNVNVYTLDGYMDYYYGYMVPSTGYLKYYKLYLYDTGFVIQMPERKTPRTLPEFVPQNKMYKALKEATVWGEELGVNTVGDLNNKICEGDFTQLVLVQEALIESKIAAIAQDIVARGDVKFVMIAGPSSSGKTTFSHRLSIQLTAHGMKPHPIGLDDYFVNREFTPLDEDGNYNFECLGAIDVEGFNSDMTKLLNGETVEMPSFNFKTGKREYKGNFLKLGPEDILVIEGIHGLNEKMSYKLPMESKYKIYISALTALNVDEHNRIATTDSRLIRRMVRDFRTRGASAKRTLSMWESVRRGEEENIFPFQETADAHINSSMIYELAVLKQFAEPLLFSIKPDEPEYQEAKRLLKFLEYFLGVTSENLPNNSIIREFVGGSLFPV